MDDGKIDWNNRDLAISALKRNGALIIEAGDNITADREAVLAAISSFAHAFRYAHLSIRGDKELLLGPSGIIVGRDRVHRSKSRSLF